jgi:hypothetical protein
MLNMIFGILPFFAAILMTQMKEDSHPAHLWLSIVKHFPRLVIFCCSPPLTQMPLGFGNAVVLQTMFSQSYINYIIGCAVMIADMFLLFSRLSFSSARVADGCWNGFCSIAKRFRFVGVINRKMCQFTNDVFFLFLLFYIFRTSRGSCVRICSIPISTRYRASRASSFWFGRSMCSTTTSSCVILRD